MSQQYPDNETIDMGLSNILNNSLKDVVVSHKVGKFSLGNGEGYDKIFILKRKNSIKNPSISADLVIGSLVIFLSQQYELKPLTTFDFNNDWESIAFRIPRKGADSLVVILEGIVDAIYLYAYLQSKN